MKPFLICSIVILQMIAMPLSAADAQTTQYRHPATGLIFPDSVEGIIRGNVKDFEGTNPRLGVSVPYDRPGITVTVYILYQKLSQFVLSPLAGAERGNI